MSKSKGEGSLICPDCKGSKKLHSLTCVLCHGKRARESNRIRHQEKRDAKVNGRTIFSIKCSICQSIFDSYKESDDVCSIECKEIYKNKKINQDWLEREKA